MDDMKVPMLYWMFCAVVQKAGGKVTLTREETKNCFNLNVKGGIDADGNFVIELQDAKE